MSFVTTDEFSVRVTQGLLQGLVCRELAAYFSVFDIFEMAILSKEHKADKFESHNSLKLSFTYI